MHSHPLLWASYTQCFLTQRFDAVLHKKTLGSVYYAVLGTLTSARAGIAHIGRGLSEARGMAPKHAIKQVDRLFRNELLSVEELTPKTFRCRRPTRHGPCEPAPDHGAENVVEIPILQGLESAGGSLLALNARLMKRDPAEVAEETGAKEG